MAKFSERQGFTVPIPLQIDAISDELRMAIWNILVRVTLKRDDNDELWFHRFRHVYNYLGFAIDEVFRTRYGSAFEKIKVWFFNETTEWYEIFNFIEYCANNADTLLINQITDSIFTQALNDLLVVHNSGYRFMSNQLVPITSEIEIKSIECALNTPHAKLIGVRTHITAALNHLSKKPNPDYRNSIHEAVMAVESLAKVISGKTHATLPDALKALEKVMPLHGAMRKGLENLYGYTSDVGGIRHGLTDESNIEFEEAIYMLVICSAFINYMTQKANKLSLL